MAKYATITFGLLENSSLSAFLWKKKSYFSVEQHYCDAELKLGVSFKYFRVFIFK